MAEKGIVIGRVFLSAGAYTGLNHGVSRNTNMIQVSRMNKKVRYCMYSIWMNFVFNVVVSIGENNSSCRG